MFSVLLQLYVYDVTKNVSFHIIVFLRIEDVFETQSFHIEENESKCLEWTDIA